MSDYIRQHNIPIDYKIGESWSILNEIEQSIKQKIEAVGTPLKDWDIKINYGIKTGLNEAFIISKEKRDELIAADPKSAEIIRPILRGRDIKKHEIDFQNIYLINTHNGYIATDGTYIPPINIEYYPAIKDWFDNGNWNTKKDKISNFNRLSKRTDQGITPYNLRSLAYMDDFNKQKIIFSEMVQTAQFYLDNEGFVINDTVTFMSGSKLDFLIDYLNSSVVFNIYSKFYAGGSLGSKGTRVKKTFLEKLPIPQIKLSSNDIDQQIKEILELTDKELQFITQ